MKNFSFFCKKELREVGLVRFAKLNSTFDKEPELVLDQSVLSQTDFDHSLEPFYLFA